MCGLSISLLFSSSIVIQDAEEYNTPKSSAGEITILTPENRTYIQPDSGYYPATHNFDDEVAGTTGTAIDFVDIDISDSGCSASIVSLPGSHKNVIKLEDSSGGGNAEIFNLFDSVQPFGSIEFYMYDSDASDGVYPQLWDSTRTLPALRIYGDTFQVYTTPGWIVISGAPTPQDNSWYHIRLDFECTAGGYEGLSQWDYYVWIDGTRYGPYDFNQNYQPDRIRLITSDGHSNYYGYFHAFGYSWDPNYNIGDNLNEGLLLSYENTTTLDWKGYSLDGGANKTILGNTTIPMPADGGHNIQVFGNDSINTMYESNLRYFTVNTAPPEITINAPTDSQIISSTAPSYDISIAGLYDSLWYALEGGTNYTLSGLVGTIDQAAWSALSDGIITIDFYANNSVGMEGTAQVQVFKDSSEEPPQTPPGIPGYDLYLLLGAISIISAILIRKRVLTTKIKEVIKN